MHCLLRTSLLAASLGAALGGCASDDTMRDDAIDAGATARVAPNSFLPPFPIELRPRARVRGNTQVKLPRNLWLADVDGDGAAELLQQSANPSSVFGQGNRIFVTTADVEQRGIAHLYLTRDAWYVTSGRFRKAGEAGRKADDVCAVVMDDTFQCFVLDEDGTRFRRWLKQPSFRLPYEEMLVGDYDGDGVDEILLYNPYAGSFRMVARTTDAAGAPRFAPLASFTPGNLGTTLTGRQIRVGTFNDGATKRDGLMVFDPATGSLARFDSATDSAGHVTFWWAWTGPSGMPVPSRVQLDAVNLDNGLTDGIVLRDTATGAYRMLTANVVGGAIGVSTTLQGQLPVMTNPGQVAFAPLRSSTASMEAYRDDAFWIGDDGSVSRVDARWDTIAKKQTFWWAFSGGAPQNDFGWPMVKHDKTLILKCKWADHPTEEPARFNGGDVFLHNALDMRGAGLGGMADYMLDNTYGLFEVGNMDVRGWYSMTLKKTWADAQWAAGTMTPGEFRRQSMDNCVAQAKAKGLDTSAYVNIIAVWNVITDAGADGIGTHRFDMDCKFHSLSGTVHEFLHSQGLTHANGDRITPLCGQTEYCDIWDPMGAGQQNDPNFDGKMSTYHQPAFNPGVPLATVDDGTADRSSDLGVACGALPTHTESHPEMNAQHRQQLGAVPAHRVITLARGSSPVRATFTLAAVNRPEVNAPLLLRIQTAEANRVYTVEYRQRSGWDRNLPKDAVLLHDFHGVGGAIVQKATPPVASPTTTAERALQAEFAPGETFTFADGVKVEVLSFDARKATATVAVTY